MPRRALQVLAVGGAVLVVAALCWIAAAVLLRLAFVSFTLAVALLFTALLSPLASALRRVGMPRAVAAGVSVALLVVVPTAAGFLLWTRAQAQLQELGPALKAGLDDVRSWLVTGPLSMDPTQVDHVRDELVRYVTDAVPGPVAGARTALQLFAALALAFFTIFFLLKDGAQMWQWVLARTASRRRNLFDGAGQAAWDALTSYVAGVTVVALADSLLIGGALLMLDVPLWLSLAVLTFVGAFVPILGATVSGAFAVLVTLVTNGPGTALIILIVVLVVQQVEGNLLQPLIMGRAVNLHPVVTLVAVTSGTLLLGIAGAVVAVPLVAVTYRVAECVRTSRTAAAR